jgi:TonB family protein
MLTYLLQTSTCLIILYGIYHFILAEMTFFKYNRAYLLLSILASLMIPILAPLLVLPEESVPVLHWSHLAGDITYIVADNAVDVFDWKSLMINVLWVIYLVGVVVVLLKMMIGISKIFRYYRQGQKEDFNGYRIITTEAVHLPFSFFKGIYVSRHVPLQDHIHTILEHEEIHIRQWHTLDVLMAEMVHAFFWFNPVMIFYKRALRQAHEYLADDLICRKNSVSSYTELLLSKSQSGLELALTNQFFHSQIKKRIQMMTTHKTNQSAAWKYALVLPLLMGLVVLFSSSSVKQQLQDVVAASHDSIPKPPAPTVPPPPPASPAPPMLNGNALMPVVPPPPPPSPNLLNIDPTLFAMELGFDKMPLILVDEKAFVIGKVKTEDLESLEIIKSESDINYAIRKFGKQASNGAILLYTKSFKNPFQLETDAEIFKVVEQMPRFPGCEHLNSVEERSNCASKKMLEYINTNLVYPAEAKQQNLEGTVVAQFVVSKDGIVSDINIVRDIGGSCGQAVITTLQTMNQMPEKWIPGIQSGKNVNVLYTLPVKFKMTDDQPKTEDRSKNNNAQQNLNIFPNPTSDQIELSLTGSREDVEVSILDMAGKLLYKNKFDNRQEQFKTKIDINQINVPTILVKTVQGNKVSTKQVVIRK